jgi:hypothetical protein
VIVTDLNGEKWDVNNIDPYAGQSIGGGLLYVPKLSVDEALKKYGNESHH